MADDSGAEASAAELQRLYEEQRELRLRLAQPAGQSEIDGLRRQWEDNQARLKHVWAANNSHHPDAPVEPAEMRLPADQPGRQEAGAAAATSPVLAESDGEVDDLLNTLVHNPSRAAPASRATGDRKRSWRGSLPAAAVGAVGMAVLLGLGSLVWQRVSSDGTSDSATTTEAVDVEHEADEIRLILGSAGLNDVTVEVRDRTIYLVGTVPRQDQLDGLLRAAATYEDEGVVVDTTQLVLAGPATGGDPSGTTIPDAGAATLQRELNRLLDATPLVFTSGQSEITELQKRILGNVASLLLAYPGLTVNVIGYTDESGSDETNTPLSLVRAQAVRSYLISQGVADATLVAEGRGEATASGAEQLAGLERRVELEVVAAPTPAAPSGALRIGLVAPSARNDVAFTQSMVDALNVIAAERGNVEISIVDNTFVAEDVAAEIRRFATEGYDLVIAHGSQFGPELLALAGEFSDVVFAWGTAAAESVTTPNVYAYDVAAEEGGYVLGALAASLTASDTIGVIGPIEVGDAQQYIEGFAQGAQDQKQGLDVRISFTGSFGDVALAAETARAHVTAGADVMTGTAQQVAGAITVAQEANVAWIGNQADQAPLAPTQVIASQVYHWEVILRPIITDIDTGTRAGRLLTADLANSGISIQLNPGRPLTPEATQLVNDLVAGIRDGTGPGPD
jgi:basic membrane protein A